MQFFDSPICLPKFLAPNVPKFESSVELDNSKRGDVAKIDKNIEANHGNHGPAHDGATIETRHEIRLRDAVPVENKDCELVEHFYSVPSRLLVWSHHRSEANHEERSVVHEHSLTR